MDIFRSGDTCVRMSKAEDITMIAEDMRDSDREEIWASHHYTPVTGLATSFKNSVICLTVEDKGKPIAMFGVVPVTFLGREGSVWLLATKDFCKVSKKFLKRSRAFVKAMLGYYPHLMNMVDVRNLESVKWLKWCGAKFGAVMPYGTDQLDFQYFEFRRA